MFWWSQFPTQILVSHQMQIVNMYFEFINWKSFLSPSGTPQNLSDTRVRPLSLIINKFLSEAAPLNKTKKSKILRSFYFSDNS